MNASHIPAYPKLIWLQSIASDTHKDAFKEGYVSAALFPIVVMREQEDSWIGFEVEDRHERYRECHFLKGAFAI